MAVKSWRDKPVEKWNTNDFMKWFGELHMERLGVEYMPMGTWAAERGHVARAIGTSKKAGLYDKVTVKRFLERCINDYKPSRKFPGTNIGFCLSYRKNELQQVLVEVAEENKMEAEQAVEVDDSLADWFSQ